MYTYAYMYIHTYIQGDIDTYATPQWPQAEKDIIPCSDVGPGKSIINGKGPSFLDLGSLTWKC